MRIAFLLLLLLPGCDAGSERRATARVLPSTTTLPAPAMVDSETPVILVHEVSHAVRHAPVTDAPPPPSVIAAVWSDGRIVWRDDGALRQSRVEIARIDALMQRLHLEGVFGNGRTGYECYGPDSSTVVIDVRLPDRSLVMESWHDGFERNPELVATSNGVEGLSGRDRAAVLAAEPEGYRRFRRIWAEIRMAVESWIPADGEPFAGEIPTGGDR